MDGRVTTGVCGRQVEGIGKTEEIVDGLYGVLGVSLQDAASTVSRENPCGRVETLKNLKIRRSHIVRLDPGSAGHRAMVFWDFSGGDDERDPTLGGRVPDDCDGPSARWCCATGIPTTTEPESITFSRACTRDVRRNAYVSDTETFEINVQPVYIRRMGGGASLWA